MKTIISVLLLIFISQVQSGPFGQFLKVIPRGWSGHIDKSKLVVTRDSAVKIQYFNYGMEAEPTVLDHKIEIVIEYWKRLSSKEIEKRKNQRDSLLVIYKRKFELNPSKENWAKYEMIKEDLNKNKRYLIPIYSDDNYSYFMQDNIPYGYIFINDSDKNEIEGLIYKLSKRE